jgi:hypothetical protein
MGDSGGALDITMHLQIANGEADVTGGLMSSGGAGA